MLEYLASLERKRARELLAQRWEDRIGFTIYYTVAVVLIFTLAYFSPLGASYKARHLAQEIGQETIKP